MSAIACDNVFLNFPISPKVHGRSNIFEVVGGLRLKKPFFTRDTEPILYSKTYTSVGERGRRPHTSYGCYVTEVNNV